MKLHNDLADAVPPTQDKKPRWPGSGHRETLTTGYDTMPIAVLSHDENGLAQEIWRAHALKPLTGEGTPPKVIRQLFIATGGPPPDLLHRRAKALKAAHDAEAASRTRRLTEIQRELGTNPSPARRQELESEVKQLRGPFPSDDEFLDRGDVPFNQSNVSLCAVARDGLQATFISASVFGP